MALHMAAAILRGAKDVDGVLTDLLAEQGKLGVDAQVRIGGMRSVLLRVVDFLSNNEKEMETKTTVMLETVCGVLGIPVPPILINSVWVAGAETATTDTIVPPPEKHP